MARVHRSARRFTIPVLLTFVGLMAFLAFVSSVSPKRAIIALLLSPLATIFLPLLGSVRTLWGQRRLVDVSQDEAFLHLRDGNDGAWRYQLARADIESAAVQPVPPAYLEIRTKHGDVVEISVDDPDDAWKLLDAVSLDPKGHHATFRNARLSLITLAVVSTFVVYGVVLVACRSLPSALQVVAWTIPAVLGFLFLHLVTPSAVTVGTDAVIIQRLGRQRRVIPHEDISGMVVAPPYLQLDMRTGSTASVRLSTPLAHAAVARMRHARMYGVVSANDALLDLRGATAAQARERLGKIGRKESAYRAVGISDQDLVDIATHPSTPANKRVAAAWAIGLRYPELRDRVRVALDQLAEPRVRVLVDKALEDRIVEEDLATLESSEINPSTTAR